MLASVNRMWPNSAASKSADALARSFSRVACISFSTYGWQRMAPWPNTIRLRVRMLAPSTVIATGICMYAAPRKFDGPMQMPLPPTMSIASLTTCAAALGEVQLGDAGHDRRLLAEVDRGRGQRARGVHHVEIAAHARQRFLDALELADRRLELRAHAGVAAGRADGELGHPGRRRRQRNAAPGGEALHQHPPAAAQHRLAADDPVHRDEHVLAPGRPVLEHRIERHVPATDLDARVRGRDQRAGDADVLLVADQAVGVVGAERETEQGRDRTQRDVALVPGDPQAERRACPSCSPQQTMP